MTETYIIIILWLLFAFTHSITVIPVVRFGIVEVTGVKPYLGIYSLISLVTFGLLMWYGLSHRSAGPELFWMTEPMTMQFTGLFVFLGLCAYAGSTGKTGEKWGVMDVVRTAMFLHAPRKPLEVTPERRITRHPQTWGFALFGLGHALANGSAANVALWLGFPVYMIFTSWVHDRRLVKKHGEEAAREYFRNTSFIPFAGIITGRVKGPSLRRLPYMFVMGNVYAAGFYILGHVIGGIPGYY